MSMATETNPFYFATVEQGGGAVAPDQIKDSQDYPHTGLIKALQLGMQGNFAIKGAANEFDITQASTDPVLSVSAGKIFQDNLLTPVNSATFNAASFNNTANNYHLLVAEKSGVGSAQLAIRKFSDSTTDRVPETNARDAIIAVIRYTDDGFGNMEVQYLTTDKIQNHLSISQGSSGDTVYTEAARMVGGTSTVDFVTQGNRNLAITPDGTGELRLNGLVFPDSDGTIDQVIKTDGNGNLSFTTISTGTPDSIADADGDTKIQVEESSDEDKIRFDTAGTERMIIDNTGKVGIGTSSPSELLHLSDADAGEPTILIENTGTNATEPELIFLRSTGTGADSRDIGHIKFKADDTAGNPHTFVNIFADSEDADTTTEDGRIIFNVTKGGTDNVEQLRISGTSGIVFNDGGADINVRIEGSSEANLFFTDAGNDRVGIGTNTPSTELDVQGDIRLSGEIEVNGDLNHDGSNVGFYGTTPASQQNVGNMASTAVTPITPTNPTAPAGFEPANEAYLLSLEQEISNLRTKMDTLIDALQLYGLIL